MTQPDEPRDAFWDLLAEIARLQEEMGKDLVAWARAYEAGCEAFQSTAQTLRLMADAGRRFEQYLRSGPPAGARQALQFLLNPLQSMAATPAAGTLDPFTRFWQAWTAPPGGKPTPGSDPG